MDVPKTPHGYDWSDTRPQRTAQPSESPSAAATPAHAYLPHDSYSHSDRTQSFFPMYSGIEAPQPIAPDTAELPELSLSLTPPSSAKPHSYPSVERSEQVGSATSVAVSQQTPSGQNVHLMRQDTLSILQLFLANHDRVTLSHLDLIEHLNSISPIPKEGILQCFDGHYSGRHASIRVNRFNDSDENHKFGILTLHKDMYYFSPGKNFGLIPSIRAHADSLLREYHITTREWSMRDLSRLIFLSSEQPYTSKDLAAGFRVSMRNLGSIISRINGLLSDSKAHIAFRDITQQGEFRTIASHQPFSANLDFRLQRREKTS